MISVICPAKLNLGLRVLGRRADGYHDLAGLMVALPWFDRVDVEFGTTPAAGATPVVNLKVSGDAGSGSVDAPDDDRNIVVRAARLYLEHMGTDDFPGIPEVSIHLRKTIPSGTGLGGASSDAAGTLLAMDDLVDKAGLEPICGAGIRKIAASLGSDVVFFLNPAPSMIVGRGEDFAPAASQFSLPVVVAVPRQRLSTAEVFSRWDADANLGKTPRNALTVAADSDISPCLSVSAPVPGGRAFAPEMFENDLSDAVFALCPRAASLAGLLVESGARVAAVTGSGSAVYGVCDDMVSARDCAAAMARVLESGEIVRAFQAGTVF